MSQILIHCGLNNTKFLVKNYLRFGLGYCQSHELNGSLITAGRCMMSSAQLWTSDKNLPERNLPERCRQPSTCKPQSLTEKAKHEQIKELLSIIKFFERSKMQLGQNNISGNKGITPRPPAARVETDAISSWQQDFEQFQKQIKNCHAIALHTQEEEQCDATSEVTCEDHEISKQENQMEVKSKSKKRKKKSKKNLVTLFQKPFVEYMESLGPLENVEPEVLAELESLLQDPSLTAELAQNIQDYITKVTEIQKQQKMEETEEQEQEQEDTSVLAAEHIDQSQPEEPLWSEEDLDSAEKVKEISARVCKIFHSDLIRKSRLNAIERDAVRIQFNFNSKMAVYVDACVFSKKINRAHALLRYQYITYQRQKKRQHQGGNKRVVTDVGVYTTVMQAWAKEGKLQPLQQLMTQLHDLDLKPELRSYLAVLECVGNMKDADDQIAERMVNNIVSKGYQLENMSAECSLTNEQWAVIESVIRQVHPEFTSQTSTQFHAEAHNYSCDLLNHLNTEHEVKNPFAGVVSQKLLAQNAARQMDLELSDSVTFPSIQPSVKITHSIEKWRNLLKKTRNRWRMQLESAFKRDRDYLKMSQTGEPKVSDLIPYLSLFSTDIYADIMMQQIEVVCQDMGAFSPSLNYLYQQLGLTVYQRMMLHTKQQTGHVNKMQEVYDSYLHEYNKPHTQLNLRQAWHKVMAESVSQSLSLESSLEKWPLFVAQAVGKFLLDIIITETKVDTNILKRVPEKSMLPAFYTVIRTQNNTPQEQVMPHPVLVRLYSSANETDLTFRAADMPTLSPPLPWIAPNFGGNILSHTDLIKNKPAYYTAHVNVPQQQLFPVFDSLNAVGAVPWKINHEVLDLMIHIFNAGGNAALDIAPPKESCPKPPEFTHNQTTEERLQVVIQRSELKRQQKEMYSLWCTELYRLSIANKYRDEVFWFPHSVDFRSRFYAVPPHFNHLGGDVARGLLMFACGKPLGSEGLDWLKIHLVNLTGLRKRSSNADRLAYANGIMGKILDSADNPLEGEGWWQHSDEPWQTLACCKEIAKATRSPDPAKYVSHFPVHQLITFERLDRSPSDFHRLLYSLLPDGSCNGLQHYAALGRDRAGAESVNLTPSIIPSDVYSDVVELVEQQREADLTQGHVLADVLEGFVKRKVIKQTIMTTVYGVTRYGARQQIRNQLRDIDDFPRKHVWEAGTYLTEQTFESLQQMFTSTKQIQDWFVACAELVARVRHLPIEWVTPVGWPVTQPYYRHATWRHPQYPHRTIKIEKPNAMKQKNAFPPNLVHSLDSTHMMLTAIHCLRQGLGFVAVHDCYWTHPADIHTMNKVCREQFVALHSQPILEDLADSMVAKCGFPESEMQGIPTAIEAKKFVNAVLAHVPERGEFELEQVLDSTYFFS